MSKRKWTDVSRYGQIITEMRQAGYTRQEIADALGLEKFQIKNWINQQNRAKRKVAGGVLPKPKGRPRKYPLTTTAAYEKEIAHLRMENKLLRDFLQFTERM